MRRLFRNNEAEYRLARTIIQGVIAVIVANLDVIFGVFSWPPEIKALIVALTMAVLSPIMAALGGDKELPEQYWEKLPDEIRGRFGGDDK